MKQLEVTEKKIGENTFYIKPFPAFEAAAISGDLATLITTILGSIAPLVGSDGDANIMDADLDKALPLVTNAMSGLSGEKLSSLMKKLLINSKNISVEGEATDGEVKQMTLDIANEVFCGEVQDMFVLCFEVIKLNYKGFFKKLAGRFGNLRGILEKTSKSSNSTEN